MSVKKYHLKKTKTINSLVEIGDQSRNSYDGNKTYNKCHSMVISLAVSRVLRQGMEALCGISHPCPDIFNTAKSDLL